MIAAERKGLTSLKRALSSALLALPETTNMELLIQDWITLSIQMAVDEVEASFENTTSQLLANVKIHR